MTMDKSDQRPDSADFVPRAEPLRGRSEAILSKRIAGPHARGSSSPAEEERSALHEVQMYQIELELQNEELRRTQVDRDASRERYFELYDRAPVGYCTVSMQGIVLEANLTAATMLGMTRKTLVDQPISQFIVRAHQDIYYLQRKQLVESGEAQARDLRMVKSDGVQFWVSLVTAAAQDSNGVVVHRVILSDIADRKQAEEALQASEQRYRRLADDMPIFLTTFLPDGTLTYINHALLDAIGMTADELSGRNFFEFLSSDDGEMVKTRLALLTPDHPLETHEQWYRKPGKIDICEKWTNRAFFDSAGNVTYLQGIGEDITASKKAEIAQSIAAIAFESQSGILITDADGIILRVNQAFSRVTGFGADEIIGKKTTLLKSGRHDPTFYQHMWRCLKEKSYWQGEIWNRRKNGQIYAELLTITAISMPDKGVTNYVGTFADITQDKEAEAAIHRLAYYDALTSLPNRRLLHDRLGQALAATARSGLYGAIFFIDLDNFKVLNDTRGHDIGDLLLVEVAQRLQTIVREGDTVARHGGDEFVVVLEDLGVDVHTAAVLAKQIGEKLSDAFDAPFLLKGHEYFCKLSVGVGLFHEHDTVEDLFKHADLALYQAKSAGRNTLRFFDPAMQVEQDQRSALETELRHALKRGELRLHYQPQIDAKFGVIGVEALLRWRHSEGGLIPPNDFIPLAEETGLILPIGLWVLQTACALIKAWEAEAQCSALQMAVNVSPLQFRQADFVAQVQKVLESSGANPVRLKLELTESVVLENVADAIQKMEALKQIGVSFSLDDFGTGYSSLAYLTQLPINQIKIDKSFVLNLPGKVNDETIARTIITMSRELGIDVIAEGVETEGQRKFLDAHGCHAYQGYLFSRPLPLDDFHDYLRLNRNQF